MTTLTIEKFYEYSVVEVFSNGHRIWVYRLKCSANLDSGLDDLGMSYLVVLQFDDVNLMLQVLRSHPSP